MMDIKQASDNFIKALYRKSKDNFAKGYSVKIIGKLLGFDRNQEHNVLTYLSGKGLINTQAGFGDSVPLTTDGIDYSIKLREGKVYKLLRFKAGRHVPSSRDAIEFLFDYDLVDEDGTNREEMAIKVMVTGDLCICWGFQIWQDSTNYNDLEKILLQYGKDRIIEKVKEKTLTEYEEMLLTTSNYPTERPFNPENLIETKFAEYEIETGNKMLSEEVKENKLAASIIETRDRINAIFHSKYRKKLLLLNEERNLLDFFKTAKTEEEFSHRLSSLAQVSRNMNVDVLRELTNETDKELGSVALLDKLLSAIGIQDKKTTEILKHIGRIRQGYPVHTDITGVIQGYKYFGIKYPIEEYEVTWTTLLNHYLTSLTQLHEILADTYLVTER
jgi:hypothetical protein